MGVPFYEIELMPTDSLITHANSMQAELRVARADIERLRGLILRACAELETVEYECDPPARIVALMDELRAVNRDALLRSPVERSGTKVERRVRGDTMKCKGKNCSADGNNNHSDECQKEHESQHMAETPPSCFDRAEYNGRVFDNCRFFQVCKQVKPICVDCPLHVTPNVKLTG
jgi:hypothetical protein